MAVWDWFSDYDSWVLLDVDAYLNSFPIDDGDLLACKDPDWYGMQ